MPAIFSRELAQMMPKQVPVHITGALERVLLLKRLQDLYEGIRQTPGDKPFCDKLLASLNVHVELDDADRARIPAKGPVVVVANHPFGMIEGAMLAPLLLGVRPDVKFMANQFLASIPELREFLITVDPFGTKEAARSNLRGLKDTLRWLRDGGMVVVFPAGEVSHLDMQRRSITDPAWSRTIGRIVSVSRASVLPIYFRGGNSPLFHLAGMIHPRLRTAMLPHELLNKNNQKLRLSIGSPIAAKRIEELKSDEEVTEYLRRRTYLLENREPKRHFAVSGGKRLVAAVAPALMESEIAELAVENKLVSSGEFEVYIGTMPQMPNTLREIARLRELTFRAAGEGTGKALDSDSFDAHYLHLFIWNRETREVVGAYRLGATDHIRSRFGSKGLYTSSLFSYGEEFLDRLGNALEMGRSFVRPEYQKSYNPLLLLWKGIAAYVVRQPRYTVLFGPVSISNDYCDASRQLIVQYLSDQLERTDLARLVKPRTPFRPKRVKGWESEAATTVACSLDELSAMVADMETDQKGVPVLLRQYLKLGGKLAGFNVDGAFAKALDGLIIVDLRETDAKVLERYMGKDGYATFRRANGVTAGAAR